MQGTAAFFTKDFGEMGLRLLIALCIGGAIGLERSYHGRPAGFRTHALVCLSTATLMLITVFEDRWIPERLVGRIVIDPTRTAQGIMTGIGFLGAGAIMREGWTVRGLTTAASIWITAALGILIGIGFYTPALLAALLTLGTLSAFRWIEAAMPQQFYAHFVVRFARDAPMPEPDMRALLADIGFTIANLNYRLEEHAFEYRMVIRSAREASGRELSDALSEMPTVKGFTISPGD